MKKNFTLLLFAIAGTAIYAQPNLNNQVIVYFKTGATRVAPGNTTANISSVNILSVLNNYSIPTVNVVPSFPAFNEADTVNYELGESSRQMNRAKLFTVTVTNPATKNNFINSLNGLSEVLYAESNGYASHNLIPADGRFAQQWGLRNTVVPNADIHAEAAWDIFTGNANSIIAIIDDGVDVDHDDLDAKIQGGDNGFLIDLDNLGRQLSHGSHVAGIAAAITNNAVNNGVAGVDWAARIHPKNIFDDNGDPDITQSIFDAVNFNANVWTLNNSWGLIQGLDEFDNGIPGRYSVTVRSAFAHAYRNNRVSCIAMGNHQLVFGAGNRYANDVAFPAGFNTGSITVGATNINDDIANFSANGPHIDVAAPGVGIWSTNFNDNYIDLNGTSMATPYVAGLASLLKGFNINLANDDIEQIIRLSADDANILTDPGFDNQMGAGRINAERALQFLQAPNTLQQLSITGGTINNTSGNMTRIFLGVPGLADAAYIVRRSEVRRNIAFPAMCNLIGVWGRGVGTTGLREENGISFGEGICEVVPGTLTATSATLRTWIYEVWTVLGQRIGFFPQEANNVIFQYTILGVPAPSQISGDNNFCTTSTAYSIPNLPAGSIVTWSATPSGAVGFSCNPCNPVSLTRNYDAIVSLTATVTNACGDPIVINKNNVVVGFPPFIGPTGADTAWPNSNYYYYAHLPLGYPPVSDYYWELPSGWTILSGQGTNTLYVRTGTTGGAVEVDVTACGITRPAYNYVEIGSGSWWPDGGGGDVYMRQSTRLSPNPADNFVTISMGNNNSIKTGKEANTFFNSVTIYDINGAVKKRQQYKAGTRQARVNTSELRPGAYIVEVSDGRRVERQQLIIQK